MPVLGRVNETPLAFVVGLVALAAASVFLGDSVPPLEVAAYGLAVLALLGQAFERTRTARANTLATMVLLTVTFGLFYLSPPRGVLKGVLVAVGAVSVVVETYNLATDSTLLHWLA